MIAATAWCGCVYALVGGQPMMINGGTGPVLAFSEIIYKLSVSMDVPFLTFNAVSERMSTMADIACHVLTRSSTFPSGSEFGSQST